MKSETSKWKFDSVLGTFNLDDNTSMETGDDCNCFHDEADVTMVSFVLETAKSGQSVVRILSDDTEFCGCSTCVLGELGRLATQGTDGALGWISTWHQWHLCWSWSEMIAASRYACVQWLWYNFLPLQQRNGQFTKYYGFWKLPRLSYYRLCWYISHRVDECSNAFFVALNSQQIGTSMESARYNILRKKKRNPKAIASKHLRILRNTTYLGSSSRFVVENSANKKVLQASQTIITY